MTILVTGAGGFIGSHLVENLLSKGHSVRAMVHYNSLGRIGWLDGAAKSSERLELVSGDICDKGFVASAVKDCSTVFHLAALIGIPYSYVAPGAYVSVNISGTLNVLEAAKESGARVIHTSTSEVYGSAQTDFINEHHPLVGQSPYSATKIAADHLVESYARSFGLDCRIVRPFNTFGPRQSARAIIPQIISQAISIKELCPDNPVVELGALTPTRDLTFVTDTVSGFIAAAASDPWPHETRVVNLGTGYSISVENLAHLIFDVLGVQQVKLESTEERVRPKFSEVQDLRSDNSLARKLISWTPTYRDSDGLRTAIKITVDWFQENKDSFPGGYAV